VIVHSGTYIALLESDYSETLEVNELKYSSELIIFLDKIMKMNEIFSEKNRNGVPVVKKTTGTPFLCVPVRFEPCWTNHVE